MFSFFFGSPTEEKSKKQKKRARAQKKKKDTVTLAPIGVDDEGKNDDDEGRSDDESDDEGDEPDVFLPIQVPTERLTAELNLEASNLDPLTNIVDAVLRQGPTAANFTREQVMACLMQMWDEGQAYDDPECVLHRLMLDAAIAAAENNSTTSNDDDSDSEVRCGNERDEPPEQLAEPTARRVTKIESAPVAPHDAFPAIPDHDSVSMQASPPSLQHAQHQALLASLPARLELAASHADKDLTESLSALCSWAALVTTASTTITAPSQISREASVAAFFDSRALEMLFQQVFSQPDRLLHQLPAVQAGLSSLLHHLLCPTKKADGGGDVNDMADGLLRGLEGALSQIRDIHELKRTMTIQRKHTTPGGGADVTADVSASLDDNTVALLVQRVCAAVRSAYHHSTTSSSSSSSQQPHQAGPAVAVAVAVRSPVEVLREIDGQLCQVSAAMAHSQPAAAAAGSNVGELQRSLVLREMASDKLTLLLQSLEEIAQCVTATDEASAISHAQHPRAALALDPLGAALLEGAHVDISPFDVAAADDVDGGLIAGSTSTNTSVSGSPVRGGNGSVNTNASVNGGGGVSVDALLGQQMQSLQAESRSRVAPLLVELEAVATQAADLHARKQSLLAELQGVEVDLTAALARSHALQSSVEEHQRVYDHKLQTLIALVPPPAPPVAAVPAAASKTTVVAGRGNHNHLSEGVRGHTSMALLQRHVTDLLGHLQTMEHPTLASTASNHHNQSRHPHQPQTSVLPSLARQVPGRVSASEAALAEYVEYEGRCLSMLADRLVASRTGLAELQAEHEAYQGLNMKGMLSGTTARLAQASMEVADDERAVRAMQDALVQTLSRFQSSVAAASTAASTLTTPPSSLSSPPTTHLRLPRPQLERAVAALDKASATTEGGGLHQLPPLLRPYRASANVPSTPPPMAAPSPSPSPSSSSPTISSASSSPTAHRPTMPQQQHQQQPKQHHQQQQQQPQPSAKNQQPPKQHQLPPKQPPPKQQSQPHQSSRPPRPQPFDENLYTKKLDLSGLSREQIAAADRLAREIEDQAAAALTGPDKDGAMSAPVGGVTAPSSSSSSRSRSTGDRQGHGRVPPSSQADHHHTAATTTTTACTTTACTTTAGAATTTGATTSSSTASASCSTAVSAVQSQDNHGPRARSSRGRGNGLGRPSTGLSQSNPTAPGQTLQSKANGRQVNGLAAHTSTSTSAGSKSTAVASSLVPTPAKTNDRDRDRDRNNDKRPVTVDKDFETAIAKFHGGKLPSAAATVTAVAPTTHK